MQCRYKESAEQLEAGRQSNGRGEPRHTDPFEPMFYIAQRGTKSKLSVVERKIGEIIQTLRLAKKTTREDYNQHLRLVALGLGVVGGIAFVIKLISEFITLSMTGQTG